MSSVPWFPGRKRYQIKQQEMRLQKLTEEQLIEKQIAELERATRRGWADEPGRAARGRPIKGYVFSEEELAAKRQAAIEEEAAKKVMKELEAKKKQEAQWIELGRAICSISPKDLGLLEVHGAPSKEECRGEEIVSNVAGFVNGLKKLVGNEATKGTILANTMGFAGALCNVTMRSVAYMDERIQRHRKAREEMAFREKEAQDRLDNRWIEIGKLICSLTPEDLGISIPGESSSAVPAPEAPIPAPPINIEATLKTLDSLEKRGPNDPDESDGDFEEEEEDEVDEEEFVETPYRKRRRKSKKTLAWRGEDVIANSFHFSLALQTVLGEHAKHTCFRSPFEFTSVLCNVAEKSVRDRHPARKLKK